MVDFGQLAGDIAAGYDRHILSPGKQPQVVLLVSFLLTFALVRFITHSIRADRLTWLFRNVSTPGGSHLHHLVPGILLLLVTGYVAIGLAPDWGREALGVAFGIGAALTLDEFALWLRLKDVYWAREGRESVDAVIIAASVIALILLGGTFWLELARAFGRFLSMS